MADLPSIALRVANLTRSLAFYRDALGFTHASAPVEPAAGDSDIATIVDVDGDAFLLAGPAAGDLASHLAADHWIMPSSEVLRYINTDLAALRARLASHGVTDVREMRMSWGDPALDVSDPDGRMLRFMGRVERTPEQQVALYARAMDELDAALAGLADADLDRAPSDGGWTIRQTVNHLVDSETLIVLPHVKMALAEPGRTRIATNVNQDAWADTLYARLGISESVALLRATRAYVQALLRERPLTQAWEQFVLVVRSGEGEGRRLTIGELLVSLTFHFFDHLEQIRLLRDAHDRRS